MEYLADQYLLLEDIMEDGEPMAKVARYAGLGIVNPKYIAYENGEKDHLIRQSAFHIGINKVLKSDPDKYTKIWEGKDPRYKQERRLKITITKMNDDLIKESDSENTHIYN